ncbi:hypothetical protein, partial [Haliangium sp. UPWRP_2]|uniref:hypothetical protein n=1 Tax=Haliangium sp. UPWRP_2 TaxID=1931276 RepID=UPI001E53F069
MQHINPSYLEGISRSPGDSAHPDLAKLLEADTNLCRRQSRFGDTVTMAVKAAAVFGPYANRSKWRVIYDQGSRRVSK